MSPPSRMTVSEYQYEARILPCACKAGGSLASWELYSTPRIRIREYQLIQVEFDVFLTSDKQPMVYHDLQITATYGQSVTLPITALSREGLTTMDESSRSRKERRQQQHSRAARGVIMIQIDPPYRILRASGLRIIRRPAAERQPSLLITVARVLSGCYVGARPMNSISARALPTCTMGCRRCAVC